MVDLVEGMKRAAMLDVELYEQVEHDQSAMQQAMMIVAISSIATGIGSFSLQGGLFSAIIGLIIGSIFALIGWFVFAFIIYLIGTKLMPEPQTEADHGQLLRTLGFAAAPGVLRIFGIIPGLGGLISLAASIWVLVTTVVAARQALDYKDTWRAVVVCIIGWFAYMLVLFIPIVLIRM